MHRNRKRTYSSQHNIKGLFKIGDLQLNLKKIREKHTAELLAYYLAVQIYVQFILLLTGNGQQQEGSV